jgi:hypothetical protein
VGPTCHQIQILPRRNGLLGAVVSTLRILEHFCTVLAPPAALLILEDDAVAHPKALAVLEEFVSAKLLGERWDIARFFLTWRTAIIPPDEIPANLSAYLRLRPSARRMRSAALGGEIVCFPTRHRDWGAVSTLYRGPALPAILSHLRAAPINDIDHVWSNVAKSSGAALASWICLADDPASQPIFAHRWDFATNIPKTVEPGPP